MNKHEFFVVYWISALYRINGFINIKSPDHQKIFEDHIWFSLCSIQIKYNMEKYLKLPCIYVESKNIPKIFQKYSIFLRCLTNYLDKICN